ncbi:MAG: RNA polymerase sigma factor [Anaerotignaceae bacterium]
MTNEQFKLIVKQYEKLVFSICLQFTRNYHEAENLTQETFISAFKYIDGCDSGKYKQWLARIASNKARDWLKSAYSQHVELAKEEDDTAQQPDNNPLPEDSVLTNEGVKEIKRAVLELKEPYKKVSVMFFLEEKDYEQISKQLCRPKKTVQTQVLRAKSILQDKLKGGT